MNGRVQYPVYTAAALRLADPVLLKGEIVYESDTGRHKIGNGVTTWQKLPYAADTEGVPALMWKVFGTELCVKPAVELNNSILKQCYVGILHYKNAASRYNTMLTGKRKKRLKNKGYKLVDDTFGGGSVDWTSVRIIPKPFDVDAASKHKGWMPIISVKDLFERWVKKYANADYCGNRSYIIHRGSSITEELTFGKREDGKIKQKATIYCGVVLFIPGVPRIEGPRSYFKVFETNYGPEGASICSL